MSVIDAPRICPVCKDEIIEATKASYVTYKAMPVLFHTDCLYALDEAIRESKQPIKPVHKAEPMQKHDRSTVNTELDQWFYRQRTATKRCYGSGSGRVDKRK